MQADLGKAEDALSSAVADISAHVNLRENKCLLAKEFERVTVTGNSSVQLSLEMLADVDALISEVVRCSREFYDSVEPVGRLTTGLTGALEQLANKMRLIALNAQVQAVQIGDGTGLEVLAAQTAGVSADTSGLAESIASDIERLAGTVQVLTAAFRTICDRGEATASLFKSEATTHGVRLHQIRDHSAAKLEAVRSAMESIDRSIGVIAEQADTRKRSARALPVLIDGLLRAATRLHVPASEQHRISGGSEHVRYTMASERDAHEKAINALQTSSLARLAEAGSPEPELTTELAETTIELF